MCTASTRTRCYLDYISHYSVHGLYVKLRFIFYIVYSYHTDIFNNSFKHFINSKLVFNGKLVNGGRHKGYGSHMVFLYYNHVNNEICINLL